MAIVKNNNTNINSNFKNISVTGSFMKNNTVACLSIKNLNGKSKNSLIYVYIGYEKFDKSELHSTKGIEVSYNGNDFKDKINLGDDSYKVMIKEDMVGMYIRMYRIPIKSNKNGSITNLYIRNNVDDKKDLYFYVVVSCVNVNISSSSFSDSATYELVRILNTNNPVINWHIFLKHHEKDLNNNNLSDIYILNKDDVASSDIESYILVCSDIQYYLTNHKPLYITHPNMHLFYGTNDNNLAINNMRFTVYLIPLTTDVVVPEITVIPKLLCPNLLELLFDYDGYLHSDDYQQYLLVVREIFTDVNLDSMPGDTTTEKRKNYVKEHLFEMPYASYFWGNNDYNNFIIRNFKFYDNFDFVLLPESTNYFVIKTNDAYNFNYFFNIVQPKTWDNILSELDENYANNAKNLYLYYAKFATCYCDSKGIWYLYFNPGGYLTTNEICVGLSVMDLNGNHVNIGQVTLTNDNKNSSIIFNETKKLDIYTEYGNNNTYVTVYDNLIDSTINSSYSINDSVTTISNIAEDILKYDDTKLYLDDNFKVGEIVYKNFNSNNGKPYEIHEGDVGYVQSITYNDKTLKYSSIIYSKQFSLLFNKELTYNDIKEISIIGPINYNIVNQTTDKSYSLIPVLLNYNKPDYAVQTDENTIKLGDNVTTRSTLYKKFRVNNYDSNYDSNYDIYVSNYDIYAKGIYKSYYVNTIKHYDYILQIQFTEFINDTFDEIIVPTTSKISIITSQGVEQSGPLKNYVSFSQDYRMMTICITDVGEEQPMFYYYDEHDENPKRTNNRILLQFKSSSDDTKNINCAYEVDFEYYNIDQ